MMGKLRSAVATLSSITLAAGLLPLIAAPTAQAADPIIGPCKREGTELLTCRPQVRPLPNPASVEDGTRLNVEYSAFADVPVDREQGIIEQRVFFTVKGFIEPGTPCAYSPRVSHMTTGTATRLGNGLVLSVERVRFDRIGQVVSGLVTASPLKVLRSSSTVGQAGKTFCALSGVLVAYGNIDQNMDIYSYLVSDPLTIEITRRQPPGNITANTPEIKVSRPSEPFTYRSQAQIVSTVGGDTARGVIASRLLHIGTAAENGGECKGVGSNPRYYWNISDSLKGVNYFTATVLSRDDVGRWLCAYQTVLNTNGFESTSGTAYQKIEPQPADGAAAGDASAPAVNVGSVFSRLKSATDALRTALAQPQVDQAELDRVIAEAEAAREAAAAAVQNGAVNPGGAGNAGGNAGGNPGGAGNAGGNAGGAGTVTVAQITEEIDRTSELITRGVGTATPRSALEAATGFDATVTPLLPRNTPTASGMLLNVESPTRAKKKRRFKVTVSVEPESVRGRMRMYLVYLDGDTPELIRKRRGFIGNQRSKVKRFFIRRTDKSGNYAILTSFDPTTPGDAGVATLTPLEVVNNRR